MNPELIELMRAAREALDAGRDPAEVDSIISRATGGKIANRAALADQLEAGLSAPESEGRPGIGTALLDFAKLGAQGASFGLLDEAIGVLAGAGAAVVPGGRGFSEARQAATGAVRESLDASRERAGAAAILPELAGGLVTGGAGVTRSAARGASTLARIGRGAAAGAVEGGIAGAGYAEGNLRERAPSAATGAIAGGLLGGAIPTAAEATRVVRAGRRAIREEATIGPRLAETVREESGVSGRPSEVRADVQARGRRAFKGLDEIAEIPDSDLRSALQVEEVKPFVPKEVASGSRPPSFPEAQGALRQVRKAKDRALRRGDAANFGRLAEAESRLSESLADAVEGFEDANRAYARESARARALADGQRLFSKSADEVREAFEAIDAPEAQAAFREGLAARFVSRLDNITAVPSTLRKIIEAPETREKLRIVLGSDEALGRLTTAAREGLQTRNRARVARRIQRDILVALASAIGGGGVVGGLLSANE